MLQTVSRLTKNIQDGDLVIVYESFTSLKAVDVESTGHFQNAYGLFPMKVRQEYGFIFNNVLKWSTMQAGKKYENMSVYWEEYIERAVCLSVCVPETSVLFLPYMLP